MHTLHGDCEKIGVSSVGKVNIDFPIFGAVESTKLVGKVFCRSVIIVVSAGIVGKVITDGLFRQLFLEKIDFVQEKNDGRPFEPSKTHDGLKQKKCLLHLILHKRISLLTLRERQA